MPPSRAEPRAEDVALRALRAADRSRAELDARLEQKGFDGDERLGQGRQNATAFLREHPDVTQQILQRIQIDLGPEQVVSARLLPVLEEPSPNGKPSKAKAEEVEAEVPA